ncbi:hypothetical protein CAC42_4844 [Sphaceloma murrayae]|uniref:LYR motif-containing protein Cup1-like N-terminal domain-containing protein n=1 Tax=Sphaceloma murrayae TaxID=2082308 RepID=A0A2K1QPN2_9PEZI|nr:hypothetical protein CAC42_4844 [Sphaceloma murrayae]
MRAVSSSCSIRQTRHLSQSVYQYSQEQRESARQFYRLLLREASYLPDQWCQTYIAHRIRQGFSRVVTTRLLNRKANDDPFTRLTLLSKKYLRILVLANEGDAGRLEKVFQHAYGRTGRRRRELLQPYLNGCDYGSSDAAPQLSPALHALMKSQIIERPPVKRRNNPKSLKDIDPDYDQLTIWGKPIPASRAVRKANEALYVKLDRVQLPLPEPQWNYLKDIVAKGAAIPPVPRFRKCSSKANERSAVDRSGTTLPPRLLRRRYEGVFAQCPHMTHDKDKDEWNVVWGHQLLQAYRSRDRVIPVPARGTMRFSVEESDMEKVHPS